MNFYTLDYIVSHQSLDATRRLAAIIVLLVVALAFSLGSSGGCNGSW